MRGHTPILKMRLQRKRPSIVFMDDMNNPIANDWHDPGAGYGQKWEPDHATVQIEAKDSIDRLDLRFLSGCRVSITGTTEQRAKAMFEACKRAGAVTVAAAHIIFTNDYICKSGWTEIYQKEAA